MTRLALQFFGSFHALLNDIPLTQLRSTRIQALLAYLALEAEQSHPRESLAALFWPDEPEASAKQNLRQALYQLRQALGEADESASSAPPFLLLTRTTVQFNSAGDSALDVATFLAHLERQELQPAIDLYRGELLSGLSSDSPLFEEWLVLTRERLHIYVMDALDRLTQQTLQEGNFRQAQRYARRQLSLEPWRESAHRQLMMTMARGGERNAALAQYEACRRILADELGVEPDDETKRLVEQIRSGRVEKGPRLEESGRAQKQPDTQALRSKADARGSEEESRNESTRSTASLDWGEAPDIATLYGRGDELATLERWILVERCRLVMLLGMGGIGKTALTASLARHLASHFEVVIWRSLLNAPPLNELLDGWLDLLTEQRAGKAPESLDAKLNLLFRHLRDQRCLLVLDNAESMMLGGERAGLYRPEAEEYGQLFKRIGEISHQSVLLVTSREQPQEVARLARETALVRTFALEGLGAEAGSAVLRRQGLTNAMAQAGALIQRYSGNPLALMLVAETIQEIYGGDLSAFLEGETPIFDDIRDVLDQQFARLPHLERAILLWLAIEREPITIQQMSANFHNLIAKPTLVEALNSLRRRSLLERTIASAPGESSAGADFTLQNVVTEYLTEFLVKSICQEIEQGQPLLLKSHALLKAQAKEYVRQSQARLILQPIGERLRRTLGTHGLEQKVADLLDALRQENDRLTTYAGGNLLNLLLSAGADLQALDFSGLAIWQAYLQGESLPALNLTRSDLSGCTFTDTFGAILAVGFSPDGEIVAAAATNGQIRLWRSADGQSCGLLEGHTNFTFSVLFSPDGRTLYSGSDDQTIRVWDVQGLSDGLPANGKLLQTLHEHSRGVWRLSLSKDGRWLASASGDRSIALWAVEEATGRLHYLASLHGHSQGVRAVAFHPDARVVASGCNDGMIYLWDVQKREVIARLSGHGKGHSKGIWGLAFSPNGHLLASSGEDHTVRLWNLSNLASYLEPKAGPLEIEWHEIGRMLSDHSGPVTSLAFRHDGKVLVSGSYDHTVRLWDIERGVAYQTLHGHHDEITSVIFAPKSTIFASSSMDRSVRLWDSAQGQALRTLQGHIQGVMALAFSPSSNLLANACQDGMVRLWNWQSRQLLMTLRGHIKEVHGVAFSPDGSILASCSIDQTIRLWEMPSGHLRTVIRGHQRWVRCVVFSPDGKLLATCSNDFTIRLWDVSSGELYQTMESAESVWSVCFSPDGQTLASAGSARVVHLWNLRTGVKFMSLHGHSNWVTTLAYTPDGAILASGSADQTVRLWDVASGEMLHLLQGHTAWIYGVAFSPDGQWLASASADRSVNLWNQASGERLQTLRGHSNEVHAVAFSPDGGTLASGSIDETVRLWQMPAGTSLQTLAAPRPYEMMKIDGVTGITEAQRDALKALGAIEQGS